MKNSNNSKRRRVVACKDKKINAFTQAILETGHPQKDRRGQWYTVKLMKRFTDGKKDFHRYCVVRGKLA